MVEYVITAGVLCGLLALLSLALPRRERNNLQAATAVLFFALVLLGHEVWAALQ